LKRDQEFGSEESQTPPDLRTKDSSLPNDAYSMLQNLTDRNQMELEAESDAPVFEKKSHVLHLLKVTAWILAVSAIAYSLFLNRLPFHWGEAPFISIILLSGALYLQSVPNSAVLKLFKNRIEWQRRCSDKSAERYTVIVTYQFGLAIQAEGDGLEGIEALPLSGTIAEPLHLIYHFRKLGVPVALPRHPTWANFSQATYFYKIDRLNVLRFLGVLIPSVCTLAAMLLFYWNPSLFQYWPLLVVLALSVCVLGSLAARKSVLREDGFLFEKGKVSRIVGNEQLWAVPRDDIRHVQFAAVNNICMFELVTHYGRALSLPRDPKVILPFIEALGLELVLDEKTQEEMKNPFFYRPAKNL
jgi:hypothetical protein